MVGSGPDQRSFGRQPRSGFDGNASMKVIVVNRHIVQSNRRQGRRDPPIRVSNGRYGRPKYSKRVEFNCSGRLIYDPENPLPCGATIWLELDDE